MCVWSWPTLAKPTLANFGVSVLANISDVVVVVVVFCHFLSPCVCPQHVSVLIGKLPLVAQHLGVQLPASAPPPSPR